MPKELYTGLDGRARTMKGLIDVPQLYESRDIYLASSVIIQLILYSEIILSCIPARFE